MPESKREVPITVLHTDIGFANNYRLELSKTLLALSAALFAFTISFPPALTAIRDVWILGLAWAALGVSMIGGFGNLYGWEKFYISYRDYKDNQQAGESARRCITCWRRIARGAQFLGFAVGITALAAFVVINRDNVKLAQSNAQANSAQVQ